MGTIMLKEYVIWTKIDLTCWLSYVAKSVYLLSEVISIFKATCSGKCIGIPLRVCHGEQFNIHLAYYRNVNRTYELTFRTLYISFDLSFL